MSTAFDSPDPGPPCFAPIDGHPNLISDTPMIAAMLMEQDGPWRDIAGFLLPRVDVRLRAETGSMPVVNAVGPSAVIDPPTPPWVAMRRDFLAAQKRQPGTTLDPWRSEPSPALAHTNDSGGLRLPGMAQGGTDE